MFNIIILEGNATLAHSKKYYILIKIAKVKKKY